MKIVVDMNLSPSWVDFLADNGFEATHWSNVGANTAPDAEILLWARAFDHVVLTHDLDFGAILANIGAKKPSVIQARLQDVTPSGMGRTIVTALTQFADELAAGALIIVSENRTRVRILPLTSR